jgi:hypothetical protein
MSPNSMPHLSRLCNLESLNLQGSDHTVYILQASVCVFRARVCFISVCVCMYVCVCVHARMRALAYLCVSLCG